MMTLCVLSVFWLKKTVLLSIIQSSFLLEPVQPSLKHDDSAHDRVDDELAACSWLYLLAWKNSCSLQAAHIEPG